MNPQTWKVSLRNHPFSDQKTSRSFHTNFGALDTINPLHAAKTRHAILEMPGFHGIWKDPIYDPRNDPGMIRLLLWKLREQNVASPWLALWFRTGVSSFHGHLGVFSYWENIWKHLLIEGPTTIKKACTINVGFDIWWDGLVLLARVVNIRRG